MTRPWTLPIIACLLYGGASSLFAQTVDFARDIEPIFHSKCYACHGPSQQMSGLRLDRREAALAGGYSGPALAPGDSGASTLIERVTSTKDGVRMPPAGPPLDAAQIAALKAWIDAGAPWVERQAAPLPDEATKTGHWAFRPVQRSAPPTVKDAAWTRNAIDRFILTKLEAAGVKPSPPADKIALLRRVYFDLTGLPPTPEEVDRFVASQDPRAYEQVVDELLRSPHYGEKQAIHWRDAARYADSDGYERDPQRPHAWRWRNWVIDALNRDMPFDRFTIEQIAGDLLPGATLEQRVATGFLRNGIKNREAGVMNQEKRFEEVLDRLNTIGTVWLGLTVGCAQCHDHKYDPLSQKEMYQMFAVFNNAVERDIDAPLPGQFGPYLRAYPGYRAERDRILRENGIAELQARYQSQIRAAMDNPGDRTDWDFNTTEWRAANDRADWKMRADPSELTEIERDALTDWFLSRPGPEFDKQPEVIERIKKVREQLAELRKKLPPMPRAYTMIEQDQMEPTHIALRGDWRSPGIEVKPGVPAILPALHTESKPARVAFAEWLVDPANPLTPRVTVNRMWQELFGQGLVRTANDFGIQGERPSHPELLDWLAAEFVESGWSRKHMLRLMVTSAAYRQSAKARPDLADRDPDNRWLARQNRLRLPAELVRDNALSVSGLLSPEIGGPSIRPPQPEGVAELGYAKKAWDEDTGPERYRRGLYIFFQRTSPYPMLITFDAPSTLVATVKRERSNTPLQALNLLNDPVFLEAAQALAVRVMNETADPSSRLARMFRLCLSREPRPAERDRIATHFARQKAIFAAEPGSVPKLASFVPPGADPLEVAVWTGVARAMLNLDEFLVRP